MTLVIHLMIFTLLNFMRIDRAVELKTERKVPLIWDDLNLQASQLQVRIGPPKKQRNLRSWDGKTGRRARFLEKTLIRIGVPEQEALHLAVKTLRNIWETIRKSDEKAPTTQDR